MQNSTTTRFDNDCIEMQELFKQGKTFMQIANLFEESYSSWENAYFFTRYALYKLLREVGQGDIETIKYHMNYIPDKVAAWKSIVEIQDNISGNTEKKYSFQINNFFEDMANIYKLRVK